MGDYWLDIKELPFSTTKIMTFGDEVSVEMPN